MRMTNSRFPVQPTDHSSWAAAPTLFGRVCGRRSLLDSPVVARRLNKRSGPLSVEPSSGHLRPNFDVVGAPTVPSRILALTRHLRRTVWLRLSPQTLINLIISITSMKRSDHSAGESDYDDDSYQVEDIRVGGTGQTGEEAPVKRESRKAQARKRGSIVNMLNGIKKKNLTSGQKPMEEGAADDDKPQERQESNDRESALQSESSQGRRNRRSQRNTEDKKVRNSVNLFDRVAAERFSKRGSLMVRQSSVDSPQESSVSTADEPGRSPYSHRTTISTCPTSNSRMGVNEEDEYQEKIASILYGRFNSV